MTSLVVILVAFLASMFMAWTVGAESNSPPFAPAVGAKALSVMRAALLVGTFASLGAVVQGASISEAVGRELILGVEIGPLAAASGLIAAAILTTLGVKKGYPIPTAFTVTGAITGVGLSLGGDPAIAKYQQILTLWLLIPFVGGGIALGTAYLLRRDDIPETVSIPLLGALVGFVIANIPLTLIPSASGAEQNTLAGFVSEQLGGGIWATPVFASYDAAMTLTALAMAAAFFLYLRRRLEGSVEAGIQNFLIALGAIVAFSSGGSQVGLATGPLQTLFNTELHISTTYLLVAGGLGILVGSWTGAPKLIYAVSREYSNLGVRRSIAALIPAFIIAQTAIAFGIPVSFNEIIISSVIGSGLVEGSAGVSKSKIGYTVSAWVASLFVSVGLGFVLYRFFAMLAGVG